MEGSLGVIRSFTSTWEIWYFIQKMATPRVWILSLLFWCDKRKYSTGPTTLLECARSGCTILEFFQVISAHIEFNICNWFVDMHQDVFLLNVSFSPSLCFTLLHFVFKHEQKVLIRLKSCKCCPINIQIILIIHKLKCYYIKAWLWRKHK